MNPITSSSLGVEVDLRVRGRLRSYRVRPATVREAIGVIEAASAIERARDDAEERRAAFETIRRIALGWLPLRMASDLFARGVDPQKPLQAITALLSTASDGEAETRRRKAAVSRQARRVGWHEIIADYMHAYAQSYDMVMSMPFPAFLALAEKMERVHAANMLRMLQVRGLPHIENDRDRRQRINDLMSAAGYAARREVDVSDAPDWMQDPESREKWKEEKMREALRVRA